MNYKLLSLTLTALLVTLVFQSSFAQKAFEKSNVLINGGVVLYHEASDVTASIEYGITNQIGAGIRSTYARSSNGYNILNGAIYTNYHFFQSGRVDPFAGLMLDKTYYINQVREGLKASQPINLNLQVGGRYLFTKRVGIYGQGVIPFGEDIPFGGELGLTLKL